MVKEYYIGISTTHVFLRSLVILDFYKLKKEVIMD